MPTARSSFTPRWTSAPGETIADALAERGLSVANLAEATGRPIAEAQELLEGHRSITFSLARQLGSFIGGTVEFWISRDYQYREDRARLELEDPRWLAELPIREMMRFEWINPESTGAVRARALLRFFGVPTIAAWRHQYSALAQTAAFRKSAAFESVLGATAAWLRQGETEAASITCRAWDRGAFRQELDGIRPLTRLRSPDLFVPKLQALCAQHGVAVVVIPAPTGCPASGLTRFITPEKALIQLSFRYLSDDHFWFTFFHEAGHLVLHEDQLLSRDAWILEGFGDQRGREEDAANRFAEDILFPGELRKELDNLSADTRAVIRFAVRAGISPGIVVGQLQHRGLAYRALNNLKRRYTWRLRGGNG